MDKGHLEKRITNLLHFISEPFADDGIISLDIIAESLKGKGVKVVLTGDGADEILGGYNRYNIGLYLKFSPLWLLRILNKLIKKESLKGVALSKLISLKKINDEFELHYRISQLGYTDEERRRILNNRFLDIKQDLKETYNQYKSVSKEKGKYMFDLRFLIEGNMMVKSDRVSMKSSIEFRSPFLARDVVENALLSKKKNIVFGIKKIRLKFIFIRKIGIRLLQRKKGFGAPLDSVYKIEYNKMVQSIFNNENEPVWLFVCRDEVLNILKSESHKYKRLSFHILILNIWLDNNLDK